MATKRDPAAAKPQQATAAAAKPTQAAAAEPRRETAAAKPARMSHRQERLERVRAATAVPTVRVTPASDDLRRLLKHPYGMAFRSTGSAEWPHDKFTKRRLADGSIKLTETRQSKPR